MDVGDLVRDLIERDALLGATLSKPRRPDPVRPRKLDVEPVVVGGELRYRWRRVVAGRSGDEILAPGETEARLLQLIGGEFRQALLHAADADHQILAGGAGAKVLRRAATRRPTAPAHDRTKRRVLDDGTPVPFLVELGVMTRDGKVRSAHQAKFRQVNRFLELVEDVLPALPPGALRVVDFGSGKSYLTFALHHLLTALHDRDASIVGLDLREDVVETCAALARQLDARGLHFEIGDIADYAGERPDLVVSLHACDTATDAALARAVRWQAPVILAVPCCQHEIATQLRSSALSPLLSRGLLRHRFAADVTDAARAQLLEAVGYDVQLVEFVELEHTPKNVLIRAVRRPRRDRAKAHRAYLDFRAELGIEPTLERLLADLLPGR